MTRRAAVPGRVHLVLPERFDDPMHPSGGNVYDRQVVSGLTRLGRQVLVLRAPGAWPDPEDSAREWLRRTLSRIPDEEVVLVDGLIASTSAAALCAQRDRLRLVVLLHMPLAPHAPATVAAAERDALVAARAVVVTSGWTREQVTALHGLAADRLSVAVPGVDPAPVASGTAAGARLLHVAPLVEHKGGDVLGSALGRLAALDWQCTWVGDHGTDSPFADRVRDTTRSLPARVDVRGVLTGADLEQCWNAADVLIVPSRRETYGMVVTEALAHGIPVIASDVGGLPEALGAGASGQRPGRLVPAGDVAALTGALRDWLADAHTRSTWRAAAIERRDGLPSWEDTVDVVAATLDAARCLNPADRGNVSRV